MFAAKLSLLLQMKRIFVGIKKTSVYWSVQTLIWANMLFYSAIFVTFIFACVPRKKLWNPTVSGKCISTDASIIATGLVNVVSDLSILFLPLYAVWKLKIALKKKVAIGAVFGMGSL